MKKIIFLALLLMLSFSHTFGQLYTCNDVPCGTLDPSWQLASGTDSRVCEGIPFFLFGDQSTPAADIATYRWIIYAENFVPLLDTTLNDTTPLEYLFEVDEELVENCNAPGAQPEINFQVNLVVTSFPCAGGISCRNSLEPITVVLKPRANFYTEDICENMPITFNNTSCFADTYFWDLGDGTTSNEINPVHTYSTPGTYQVTLMAENSMNECGSDLITQEVEVIGLPQADAEFILDPATGCANLDVVFTNQFPAGDNNSSATWQFLPDDGGWYYSDTIFNMNSWNNEVTFTNPGSYATLLTVTNICGMDTWMDSIHVFEAPIAILDSIDNGCIATPGTSVSISFGPYLELTGSVCDYEWTILNTNNNQMVTSTLANPILTFDEVGNYDVDLFIDGCECGDLNLSSSFVIQEPTELTFNYPMGVICSNSDPFTIEPNVGNGTWSGSPAINQDGEFDPTLAIIGANILTYNVGEGACESVESLTINVIAAPTVDIAPPVTACDELIYSPAVVYTGSYTDEDWTLIDAEGNAISYDPATVSTIAISDTGTYQFVIELDGVCNLVADTVSLTIIESISSIDAGPDSVVCISDLNYTLQGMPAGFSWEEIGGTNGVGLNVNTGEINLELAGGGIHQYQYNYGIGSLCELSDIVNIEIIDFTGVSAGPDVVICEGTPAFQIMGASEAGGEWAGPGITNVDGTFDPSLLAPGNSYIVEYCLSNMSVDCSACDQKMITINALPAANFQINGTNCVGEILAIENLSLNACSFDWDFGNGQTSTLPNPGPVYNAIGDYIITLTAISCEDCVDTFVFPISVTEPATAAFSQNVNQGCAVLEVAFVNQSVGTDLTYLWDFGNGQTSTAESPGTIAFPQANNDTTYIVNLAVTNGCGTVNFSQPVTVFPIPVVIFSPDVDDGCSPLTLDFSNTSMGNPENCNWYIDGVLISTECDLPDQTFTTSDTAITYYEVSLVIDNFCGVDTQSTVITVYPPDVEAFIFQDTAIGCQPLTVQFESYATPGAIVSWDFGDGNGSFLENPTHTFDSAGIFTIYQYASNCGTHTDSTIVEVLSAPHVSYSYDNFACDGQAMQFVNESVNIDGSSWDFGDGTTSPLESPMHVFPGPGLYTVTLTSFSSINNCPATFQSEVQVLGNPNIAFTPSAFNGCAPLSLDFENNSNGDNDYKWDFGNGEVSNETSPQDQIFNDPGTYVVTLIGTDIFGCFSDTSILNIIVHEIPDGDFTTDAQEYCNAVDQINTTNTSSGANQYYWTFGGNDTIELFEPTLIPQDTGNLTITMIAENGFGCQDITVQIVEILGTPIAYTPLSEYENCSPYFIQFGNDSEYADSYFWDFGNSNTSTAVTPSFTFENPTQFPDSILAMMVAISDNVCPSDTLLFDIIVNPNPVSNFTIPENEVCGFNDSIIVTNMTEGATDFAWNFGNGLNSLLFEPAGIYSDTGMFNITLITTNQYTCQDTFAQDLHILGSPQAIIGSSATEGCQPAQFNLQNSSLYSDNFEWNFGDGNTNSSILDPTHIYWTAEDFELILTANNANNCPSDSDTLLLTVHPKPLSEFKLDEVYCGIPASIPVQNLSDGGNDYLWAFGNGDNSTLFEPNYSYATEGEYEVSLIVTNGFSCKDTSMHPISINLQPVAIFSIADYDACAPDTISFLNASTDYDSLFWNFGEGSSSMEFNPMHTYTQPGNYVVQLTAGYNNHCFHTYDLPFSIEILPSPIADFTYEDLKDGLIQFNNLSEDAIYYDWDFGTGDFSTQFSPSYEYLDNGNWQVELTATHPNGCTDIISQIVSPEIFFGMYFPNAMSPESGVGDVKLFKPTGIGIKSYIVSVYSPWGQLLWENKALDGEQPMGSWDGSFRGKYVPQGAYVWKANIEYLNDVRVVKKGVVNVIR